MLRITSLHGLLLLTHGRLWLQQRGSGLRRQHERRQCECRLQRKRSKNASRLRIEHRGKEAAAAHEVLAAV